MPIDQAYNAPLAALFAPFESRALAWPERAAFLRARWGPPFSSYPTSGVVCEQSFKPDAGALRGAGLAVTPFIEPISGGFPLVLVLPPRQRDEARAALARAVRLAEPSGRVVAAASNTSGARSLEADLESLVGSIESYSKHKCRVFWSRPLSEAVIDGLRVDAWQTLDAPRPILDGRFVSRPGVFAWDRIDPASELLAEHLPADLAGRAADLGAGFGFLAAELLRRCAGITALDLYEAEARALDLARRNLAASAEATATRGQPPIEYYWHDVTSGLPATYDVIVTNPPFHTGGGSEDPGVGRRFIAAAAAALNPGGRLWLVANRHLPYESVLNASFGTVRSVAQRHGFKVIEARRTGSVAR